MKRYLYIDESGDVGISDTPPTSIDREAVKQGMLHVVEIAPYIHSNAGGEHPAAHIRLMDGDERLSLPKCAIGHYIEGESYHYIQP